MCVYVYVCVCVCVCVCVYVDRQLCFSGKFMDAENWCDCGSDTNMLLAFQPHHAANKEGGNDCHHFVSATMSLGHVRLLLHAQTIDPSAASHIEQTLIDAAAEMASHFVSGDDSPWRLRVVRSPD